MIALGAIPENTVIIEDSIVGRKGALDSKCHLISVENRKDLDQSKIDRIKKFLIKKNDYNILGLRKYEYPNSNGRAR